MSVIEHHPDRGRIEHDLASGVPRRQVARKYGVSRDCVYRHWNKMPQQLKAEKYAAMLKPAADLEKLRVEESEGLLSNLAVKRARLLIMQDMCLDDCDDIIAGHIHKNVT